MRRVSLISCLILTLFLISNATAEKTLKTVEMPLDYIGQTSAGETYIKTITVKPPDGIEKIISFEIKVRGDFKANTGISSRIRKTGSDNIFSCEPEKWYIPKIDVADYWLSFDCSALADKYNFQTGEIDVGIKVDDIAQNLKAYAVMTYQNFPKGSVGVMGTEYEIGDVATIFLQLQDSNGYPVNNGNCFLDVYYPQINATHDELIEEAPMLYLDDSDGIYYFDLNTPNITGVYMISATCSYAYEDNWFYEPESTQKSEISTTYGTYYGDTLYLNSKSDGLYMKCDSENAGGGSRYCQSYYDFNVSQASENITELELYYSGEASRGSTLTFYVYNWTSSSWMELNNELIFRGTSTAQRLGTNDFMTNYIPVNDTIYNDTVRVGLSSYTRAKFTQWDNWLSLRLLTTEGTIKEVKGSGEMHISDKELKLNTSISEIPQKVWNYQNRTLTDYNQTEIMNYLDYIIDNQSQQNVYLAEINSTLYDLNNLSAEDVWSFYNRTLTDYNQTVLYDLLVYINSSQEQQYIVLMDTIKSVNQTLYNEIASIRSQLHSVNNSLHTAIDGLNQSIHNDILSVLDELQTIQNNLTTIYDQIGTINSTIMNKLHSIQEEITSVNNTIKNSNISIHNRIDELSEEIEGYILNITNATVNITLNQDEIISTFLAFYDEEENEYAYSSFSAMPIFGLSSFNGKQYKCVDNKTLISIEERNITGDINKTYTIVERKECTYGCMGNTCVAPNYMIWLSAIIIILFMFGLYEYLKSKGYI